MTPARIDGGYDLGPVDSFPTRPLVPVALPERRIVVARIGTGFIAFDELCPHLSVPLSQGELSASCLTCVGHGSVFELPSGTVQKWMGRRPGLISSLLSGKPTPITTWPIDVIDGHLILKIDD